MQGLKLLQCSSEDAKDFRCGLQDELLVQDPDFSNKQMKHNRMKFRPFTSHSSYSVEMYGPEPAKLLDQSTRRQWQQPSWVWYARGKQGLRVPSCDFLACPIAKRIGFSWVVDINQSVVLPVQEEGKNKNSCIIFLHPSVNTNRQSQASKHRASLSGFTLHRCMTSGCNALISCH